MKAQLTLLFLLVSLAFAGAACQAGPEPQKVGEIVDTSTLPADVRDLLVQAAEADKPVLIDFHAEW